MDFKTARTVTITINLSSTDLKVVCDELRGMPDLWTGGEDSELKSIYADGFFGKLWGFLKYYNENI